MNAALPELLQAIRRSLHDAVLPELSSDYARGQVASIEDILGKLERMVVWSPDAILKQAHVLREGCTAFLGRATREGLDLTGTTATIDASAASLPALEAQLVRLTDWLFAAPPKLEAKATADQHAILREAMRQQLVIQRKLIPLTDFGAMTSAAPKP